ncbi:hypothetical protein FACS189415_2280 [Bacteroidia bacterium]|nr:hypothetical protein FACS189414_1200 [Bacteroidia bacterium]GHU82213.1 hypothetical protein FACS189415_2280 [Bacteroidia bacterium]
MIMTEKEKKEIEDNMVEVEGDAFMMGAQKEDNKKPNYDKEAYGSEAPVHKVELKSFKISRYPVTQAQWKAVMGDNPSYFQSDKLPAGVNSDDLPVEQVTWRDCVKFCNKLSEKYNLDVYYNINGEKVTENADAKGFRLPTEAEWEYAARGGNKSEKNKYSGNNDIDEVAWYSENSDIRTHEVGTKLPNELGLYDMSGNVWEWCNDWYYSKEEQKTDLKGPKSGSGRVLRGGSWYADAVNCRVSTRINSALVNRLRDIGFRLVLPQ